VWEQKVANLVSCFYFIESPSDLLAVFLNPLLLIFLPNLKGKVSSLLEPVRFVAAHLEDAIDNRLWKRSIGHAWQSSCHLAAFFVSEQADRYLLKDVKEGRTRAIRADPLEPVYR
jgi:hypothetical protein